MTYYLNKSNIETVLDAGTSPTTTTKQNTPLTPKYTKQKVEQLWLTTSRTTIPTNPLELILLKLQSDTVMVDHLIKQINWNHLLFSFYEQFEYTEEVIRNRKSEKDRQYNDHMNISKEQTMIHKTRYTEN